MPLKVGKRKDRPGGALWITGTVHGRVIRRSAGTGDRRAAQELANQIEARIMREVLHGPAAVITFAQTCAAYVSEGGSPRFLEPVMRHFGADALLRDITGEVAREAAMAIYPTAQPATRNRQAIAPISAVVNFGHRKGWCGPLRIERFSVPRKARRFASAEWIRQFRDACSNPRVRAAVTLMFVTGARIGSVVKLAPDDLRLGECLVIFRDTKNGDDHEAIIPSELAEEIAALPSSDPVFGYTAENGLRGAMYAVCERHGIERLTPHEAGRHGFGAMAREMTAGDDAKAAKAGGWKSVDLYRRAYAHTDDSRRDIARQMGEAIYTGDTPEASEVEISAIKQGVRE